jgi:hypothetical protein
MRVFGWRLHRPACSTIDLAQRFRASNALARHIMEAWNQRLLKGPAFGTCWSFYS